MTDEVLTQVDHRGVATVILNRPEINNAYDDAMLHGLHAAVMRRWHREVPGSRCAAWRCAAEG